MTLILLSCSTSSRSVALHAALEKVATSVSKFWRSEINSSTAGG